jgi:hypothetical protein
MYDHTIDVPLRDTSRSAVGQCALGIPLRDDPDIDGISDEVGDELLFGLE